MPVLKPNVLTSVTSSEFGDEFQLLVRTGPVRFAEYYSNAWAALQRADDVRRGEQTAGVEKYFIRIEGPLPADKAA